MRYKINIKGMSCNHCTSTVKRALEAQEGIWNVEVDLETGIATFEAEGDKYVQRAKDAVREAGYQVEE